MSKASKRTRDVDTYESDDGFVSNDDGQAPKSKKTKKERSNGKVDNSTANPFWALSSGRNPRRVEITDFKSMKLINIREYYEKDDTFLPGKKGISLTVDQYKAFLKAIPAINASLKDSNIDIRGYAVDDADEMDEEPGEPAKQKRRTKSKVEKSNIDATSDEDGGAESA